MIRYAALFVFLLLASLTRVADPVDQQIWLSHCETGSWYVVMEDPDSITVRCDSPPDPPNEDQPDNTAWNVARLK